MTLESDIRANWPGIDDSCVSIEREVTHHTMGGEETFIRHRKNLAHFHFFLERFLRHLVSCPTVGPPRHSDLSFHYEVVDGTKLAALTVVAGAPEFATHGRFDVQGDAYDDLNDFYVRMKGLDGR